MGLHDNSGPFKGWPRRQLQAWQDAQVDHYRALYRPSEDPECKDKGTTF